MEENMKDKITKGKRKDGSNEPDAIDKLETIASTAIEVYRVVKPVAKAILRNRKKSNYEARRLPRQKTILSEQKA
jgi:hypothetical protein